MNKRIPFVALFAILYLSSCTFDVCSSKRMYVNAYDQFMKKIEKKQDKFTDEQWKEMDEQFEKFSSECFEQYENDLTQEEYKKIIKHNLRYVVIRVKNELPFKLTKENEKKVNDFLDEIEIDDIKIKAEEMKKLWKEMDKKKFEDAAKDLEKGFEKLGEAFEGIGKELEKIFEENNKEK